MEGFYGVFSGGMGGLSCIHLNHNSCDHLHNYFEHLVVLPVIKPVVRGFVATSGEDLKVPPLPH